MELLKTLSLTDIQDLGICKPGHQRRLLMAIKELRYPTPAEIEAKRVRRELGMLQTHRLENVNRREYDFWEMLRHERLLPDSLAFTQDDNIKEKLTDLRNSAIMVFVIVNVLWLILIMTLVTKTELNVLGTNALGLVFLIVFGVILTSQFICMIFHRIYTWLHLAARAPCKCGQPYNTTWSFTDNSGEVSDGTNRASGQAGFEDTVDVEAARERAYLSDMMRRRTRESWANSRARHAALSREQVTAILEAS